MTMSSYWTKLPVPWIGDDGYTCCPLSVIIIGICTIILVTGVKESTRFNTAMTILNLSILFFVLVSGIFTGSVDVTNNLYPFFPHGIKGMARGAGLVFFIYYHIGNYACILQGSAAKVCSRESNGLWHWLHGLIVGVAVQEATSILQALAC